MFTPKNRNTRSSNASVMSYNTKTRMLSGIMVMNITIGNKQIIQMKR